MKIPLSWLKEFIEINEDPNEIAKTLTLAGLEIDAVDAIGDDFVFEVSLTPNLGHCSSVLGVARELSAAYQKPVQMPKIDLLEDEFNSILDCLTVEVEDLSKAPRYAARVIKDVTVAPSPTWLQERLKLCSIRPVNNIVDITNYVMIALGHPLHAFDYDLVNGAKIIVRQARLDENFQTLDDKTRLLECDDILITDATNPIAIAGVMGGLNSEISDQTKNIVIESAIFHPGAIRKTSKRLGLQTDASKRFERGTDPNIVIHAINLCANLIQRLCSGKVVKGLIDIKENEFEKKIISCRLSRLNEILGTHLGVSELESIFKKLEMEVTVDGKSVFMVKVPTYRNDVQTEIDLVEEAARIYGFENIPKAEPQYHGSTIPHSPMYLIENDVRTSLLGQGLQEFLTCDLIGPIALSITNGSNMPDDAVVKVLNPTSIEQSILRTSLLPGLLQTIKYNVDHQNHDISGFEIGRIHFKDKDKYKEHSVAAIILTGKIQLESWNDKPADVDFYDLKGIIENLLDENGIKGYQFKEHKLKTFHDARQAGIFVGDLEIGSMGEIHPAIIRKLDVAKRILFAEISLHDLYPLRKNDPKMAPLPVFPNSTRDWTLTVKEGVTYEQLLKMIDSIASKLLEKVILIDIYRSEKLGKGLKNMTLRFIYRDNEKTVSQENVDAEHSTITNETIKFIQH